MNDKSEWKWQEVVVTYFTVLSWHLLEGTKKNHEKPQSSVYSEHKKVHIHLKNLSLYFYHGCAPFSSNLRDNNEISLY
jgi:hypothetical protein